MARPMGESIQGLLGVDFDRRLKLQPHGSWVSTDADLLAYRKPDDALEPTEMAGDVFCNSRTGEDGWHGMAERFRPTPVTPRPPDRQRPGDLPQPAGPLRSAYTTED